MAASAGRPSRSTPAAERLFELVRAMRRRSRPADRLAGNRRGLRRQQYRRLRRAGGRHDGRARRRDPFGGRISDRREPGRARARFPRSPSSGLRRETAVSFRVRPARERGFPGDLRDGQADRRRLHQPARRTRATLIEKLARSEPRRSRATKSPARRSVRLRPRKCRRPARFAAPARCSAGSA